jgi:hypothetical protein
MQGGINGEIGRMTIRLIRRVRLAPARTEQERRNFAVRGLRQFLHRTPRECGELPLRAPRRRRFSNSNDERLGCDGGISIDEIPKRLSGNGRAEIAITRLHLQQGAQLGERGTVAPRARRPNGLITSGKLLFDVRLPLR